MVLQDPAALAETIKNALEKQGLLSDLKAQLRAKVVSVLEKDIPHPVKQRTETELKAIDIIYECLDYLKLTNTLTVFEVEAKQPGRDFHSVNPNQTPDLIHWIESNRPIESLTKNPFAEKSELKPSFVLPTEKTLDTKKEVVEAPLDLPKPILKDPLKELTKSLTGSSQLPPLKSISSAPPPEQPKLPIPSHVTEPLEEGDSIDQDPELMNDYNRLRNQKFHERTTGLPDSDPSYEEEIEEEIPEELDDLLQELEAESEPEGLSEPSELVTTDRTVSPTWKLDIYDHHEPVEED